MGLDRVHCHHPGMKKQPILGLDLRNKHNGKLKIGLSSLAAMARKLRALLTQVEIRKGACLRANSGFDGHPWGGTDQVGRGARWKNTNR